MKQSEIIEQFEEIKKGKMLCEYRYNKEKMEYKESEDKLRKLCSHTYIDGTSSYKYGNSYRHCMICNTIEVK